MNHRTLTPGYHTYAEAATILGVTYHRVIQIVIDGGMVPTERIGRTRLIPAAEVRRYQRERRPVGFQKKQATQLATA